jgi:20S proteasome subunit alpha 6
MSSFLPTFTWEFKRWFSVGMIFVMTFQSFTNFVFCAGSLEDLVKHGLRALRDTLPSEVSLSTKNCSLGIVSKDMKFVIYDDDQVAPYVSFHNQK